jgi:hypothetical protein
LKGKYVLLFSCHAVGDVDLNAQLIHHYGLTGIHFFSDQVNIYAVRDSLLFLGDALRSNANHDVNLPTLLRQAVERARKRKNPTGLDHELQKLLDGVTQISERELPKGGYDA